MSNDKPLSSEEYVAKGGNCCPFCGDGNINGGQVEIDSNEAYQPVSCGNCENEWTDTYKLTGYVV